MLDFTEYTKIFIALLAIVNPIGAIPIVIALTADASEEEFIRTTKVTVISVLVILVTALLTGELLLRFFGISISSFRVAGGILLLLMAISMLHARQSPITFSKEEAIRDSRESVAVVPISMPLLAGPGAISTVILYTQKSHAPLHYLFMGLEILLLVLTLWLAFLSIPWISKHTSQTGINIFSRVMGLILAAIAIEFIANGIKGLFPVLA
ncbi:MAG: NAAT family transporter [Deltaproteobacteria bacterium]|nr:NAAT family transporter [Deltaproteobacteria bacterium]